MSLADTKSRRIALNSLQNLEDKSIVPKLPAYLKDVQTQTTAISEEVKYVYSPSSSCRSDYEDEASSFLDSRNSINQKQCNQLVQKLLFTVDELQHSLLEDQQKDFSLRMALERQTDKVRDLRSSLETEKKRNQRLVSLIRGVDSSSSTDDETIQTYKGIAAVTNGAGTDKGWQSRSSMNAFESISPLLMQQRCDELQQSYKQCRHQLVKKEKQLLQAKCEKEDMQAKYDHLLDEYRSIQKRVEEICCWCLQQQTKKAFQMQELRENLEYANNCVVMAKKVLERCEGSALYKDKDFKRKLHQFVTAVRLWEGPQQQPLQSRNGSESLSDT